ncbi:TPA: hypothetical protein ACOD9X_004575 [Stenotrophomonas maltophilia]|uniref:hypothetical protein n=1 Tax=Stenotrophomonas maltophilia TaxID=40324 RepID=UPI00376B7B48
MSTKSLDKLWAVMGDIYGYRWSSAYGDDPREGTAETWAKGLAGLTGEQLAIGISASIASADPWPPTLPEFRLRCLGVPSFAAVRNDTGRRDGFTRLVWQYLDGHRYRTSSADKSDRLLREAYDQAREYVMRGGSLPEEPVAVIGQAAVATPVPASPEALRRAEREIAEIFGKGSAEPGNDDHLPATGKMAAAGLDR